MSISGRRRQYVFEAAVCPGGEERMRRLMAMILSRRVDLTALITHQYALDDIEEAFDLFSHQRDGVLKVALYPNGVASHRRAETASAVVEAGRR